MDTSQSESLGTSELPLLLNGCLDIFSRCTPTKTPEQQHSKAQQLGATKLTLTHLRLLAWNLRLLAWNRGLQRAEHDASTSDPSVDIETACKLLRTLLLDLQAAEKDATQRGGGINAAVNPGDAEQPESLFAVATAMRKLALQARGEEEARRSEKPTWFPTDQKRLDRLVEDVTESVDGLMQISLPVEEANNLSPTLSRQDILDPLSAFWLGVAASSSDPTPGKDLSRYAAEIVPGLSTSAGHEVGAGGGGPATYHQGHTYSDIRAYGNSKAVYGDQYGGALFGEDSEERADREAN